jgi:hypothetical protein
MSLGRFGMLFIEMMHLCGRKLLRLSTMRSWNMECGILLNVQLTESLLAVAGCSGSSTKLMVLLNAIRLVLWLRALLRIHI